MRWLLTLLLFFPTLLGLAQAGDTYDRASNSFLELLGYTNDRYDRNKKTWWRMDSIGVVYKDGRVDKIVSFLYFPSWNGHSPKWRMAYEYNPDGLLEKSVRADYESQKWINKDSLHYTYDTEGMLSEIYSYIKSSGSTDQLKPSWKKVYAYDVHNNDTSAITWDFDNGQWIPDRKVIKEYDLNSLDHTIIHLLHNGHSWDSTKREIYNYTDTLLVDYQQQTKLYQALPWRISYRELYSYDTTNQLEWFFSFRINQNNQLIPDQKIYYTHTNGKKTSTHWYLFDEYWNGWDLASFDTIHYLGDSVVVTERYGSPPAVDPYPPSIIWRETYLPDGDLSLKECFQYHTGWQQHVPEYRIPFYYGDTVQIPKPPKEEDPLPEPIPEVNIYPNPVIDHLNVHLPDGNDSGTLTLFSVKGQVAMNEELYTSKNVIPIQKMGLATGVYLYQLISEGQVYVGKLFVSGR